MKQQLTCGDECFIAKKQNHIRENILKKRELQEQINALSGEIEFLDADIESYRYSIRRKLGRN